MEYLLFYIGARIMLIIMISTPIALMYWAFTRQANNMDKE